MPTPRTRLLLAGVPVVAALGLTQIGPAVAATLAKPPSKAKLSAVDTAYSVRTLTVAPGARITFTNAEDPLYDVPHTLTSDRRGLFSTGRIGSGRSRTVTAPKTVGTYAFHCQVHSSMHGKLIVKK